MNGLSWILYLADVSGSTRWAAVAGMVIGAIACVIGVIGWAASREEREEEHREQGAGFAKNMLKVFVPVVMISFVFHAFLPTQRTLMLIAASELGEDILSSTAAQEIGGEAGQIATDGMKLLRKYINEQLGTDVPATTTEPKEK